MTAKLRAVHGVIRVSGFGHLTVPNAQPALWDHLCRVHRDPTSIPTRAKDIERFGDMRFGLLHDLAVPARTITGGDGHQLVAARDWGAVLESWGVRACVKGNSPLAATLRTINPALIGPESGELVDPVESFAPRGRPSTDWVRKAVDGCRLRLLFALFGTNRAEVAARRALFFDDDLADALRRLCERHTPLGTGAEWLREMRVLALQR